MITLFNTLWTNLNLSGILNWPLLPWCQLMKKFLESAGKDFGSVKPNGILYNGPYILKSFTSKSQIELDKTLITTTRKMFTSIRLNWLTSMDLTKTILLVTSQMGNLSTARLFPTSSTYSTIEKKFRITSFIPHKILLFTTLTSTLTVKTTAIRRRRLMSKRTTRRQLFKTKLPSSFELCFRQNFPTALKLTGKTEHQNSTYPTSSTYICASQRKRLRYARWRKTCRNRRWVERCELLLMLKIACIMRIKQKQNLKKQNLNCNHKVFNSQSISTML